MKSIIYIMVIFILCNSLFFVWGEPVKFPLKEIYRKGKIEFVPVIRLDNDSLEERCNFTLIKDLTLNKNNDIFVTDKNANNIKVFSKEGKFLKLIGQKGQGPGDLLWPSYLCYNGKSIIVWENGNKRFSLFSDSGDFKKIVKLSVNINIQSIKAHPQGFILIESEKRAKKNNDGQICLIDLYSEDFSLIRNIYEHKVLRGKYVSIPNKIYISTPYQPDVSWDISPNGNVIIGYQKDFEILIFNIEKNKSKFIKHSYKPSLITLEDKKEVFDSYRVVEAPGKYKDPPNEVISKIPFPKYCPAFGKIAVDPKGYLWIFPPMRKETKMCPFFDVFDQEGLFINRVEIISGLEMPSKIVFDNNGMIWCLAYGDNSEYILTKYKIR